MIARPDYIPMSVLDETEAQLSVGICNHPDIQYQTKKFLLVQLKEKFDRERVRTRKALEYINASSVPGRKFSRESFKK